MASEDETSNQPQPNTNGDTILGDVHGSTNVVVGKDINATFNTTVIAPEEVYNVHGLANPYLGLRAFTYEDRAIYAGRDAKIREALEKLTDSNKEQAVFFVTGASGSGKSSFVQAGLLPRIQEYYETRYQKRVRTPVIFRPGDQPLSRLDDALSQLAPNSSRELAAFTPADQVNVLVIDQFEEVFTQAHLDADAEFFQWLQQVPPFPQGRTHIIATVRSDYLNELFNLERLYDLNRYGLNLRTMRVNELSETIQRPLQVRFPNGERRFEPELVQKLAKDASARSTLLPLLQVTLQNLWKKGNLKLAAYTNLTDAIQQRAEEVYAFSDHVEADPEQQRPARDQQELMGILLDLINVSVADTDRRDVRQPRTRQELEQGSAHRPRLIEELVTARLLAATREKDNGEDVEVIDIIHESLIDNWDRLHNAIEEQRQRLQRRARFKLWLSEWLRSGRQDGYLLLMDMQLAECRTLAEQNDIELQNLDARSFYQRSLEYQATVQRAKDKEDAEHKARQQWLQRVGVALFITVIAAGIALWQWQQAQVAANGQAQARATSDVNATLANQAKIASDKAKATAEALNQIIRADQLAAQARVALDQSPPRALLLASEALTLKRDKAFDPIVEQTIRDLLIQTGGIPFGNSQSDVKDSKISPDGQWVAILGQDGAVNIWSVANLPSTRVQLSTNAGKNTVIAFTLDSKQLAVGNISGTVTLWSAATNFSSSVILQGGLDEITVIAVSDDNHHLAASNSNDLVHVWDINTPTLPPIPLQSAHPVIRMVFRPNGEQLIIAENEVVDRNGFSTNDVSMQVWNLTASNPSLTPVLLKPLPGQDEFILATTFTPDGKRLIAADGYTVQMWDIRADGTFSDPTKLVTHTQWIQTLALSPNSRWLVSAGVNAEVNLLDLNASDPAATSLSLKGHTATVNSASFSEDSHWLITTSDDTTVRLWDMQDRRNPSIVLRGHEFGVRSALFDLTQRWLVTVDSQGMGRLWLVPNGTNAPEVWRGLRDSAGPAQRSPAGRWVAVTKGSQLELWDRTRPTVPFVLGGFTEYITRVGFSLDDRWLIAESADDTIRFWNLTMPEPTFIFSHSIDYPSPERPMAFSPDYQWLATGYWSGTILLWNLTNSISQPITIKYNAPIRDVAFDKKGEHLVSGSNDGTAQVWDLTQSDIARNPIILRGHQDVVRAVAFSPDGRWVATGGWDEKARLWDLTAPDPLASSRVLTFTNRSYDVVFSPNGDWCVAVSVDGTMYVVDMTTPKQTPVHLKAHNGRAFGARFSPDSKRFITFGEDHTTKIWNPYDLTAIHIVLRNDEPDLGAIAFSPDNILPFWALSPDSLMKLACLTAGRNLTQDEWKQYFPDDEYDETCSDFSGSQVVSQHLLDIGTKLAQTTKTDSAIAEVAEKFKRAIELNPRLKFDPLREAKRIAAQ